MEQKSSEIYLLSNFMKLLNHVLFWRLFEGIILFISAANVKILKECDNLTGAQVCLIIFQSLYLKKK